MTTSRVIGMRGHGAIKVTSYTHVLAHISLNDQDNGVIKILTRFLVCQKRALMISFCVSRLVSLAVEEGDYKELAVYCNRNSVADQESDETDRMEGDKLEYIFPGHIIW